MENKNSLRKIYVLTMVFSLMFGTLAGIASSYYFFNFYEKNENKLIEEYYEIENAVLVSPHSIRKKIGEGDSSFILVDLRSREEYETEHIVGAVNIPAYSTPDESDYDSADRIVGSFKELKENNPNKDVIVYCYSIPCMTGRKIGMMLAEKEIYVKHLGIGWNEWKYYWNLWNHDRETQVNPSDYVISGSEPGFLEIKGELKSCSIGDFSC